MVRGNDRSISEVCMLTVTCYSVDAMVGCCDECILCRIVGLVLCVSIWFSLMMTCRPPVMLCLSIPLCSSSASLMAALMITASLSLFYIIYLFIWFLLFSWRLMAALILNLLSLFVVWFD